MTYDVQARETGSRHRDSSSPITSKCSSLKISSHRNRLTEKLSGPLLPACSRSSRGDKVQALNVATHNDHTAVEKNCQPQRQARQKPQEPALPRKQNRRQGLQQ